MENVTVNVLGIIFGAIILGGFLILILSIIISQYLLSRIERGLTNLISEEASTEKITNFCQRNHIGFSEDKFHKFLFFDPKTLGIAYGAILNHRKYHNGSLMFKYGNMTYLARELVFLKRSEKFKADFLTGMASRYPDEEEQLNKEMRRIFRETQTSREEFQKQEA
ncbi:MAG TPA: hypothetical protein P5274_01930 [Candidatus Paceibacterota bacterium]|nr:hypothetical protein [Candidatus Paceibacterota bacterium]